MQEPIAYAMRNTEATQQLITFNSPSQLLDWSFLAIETIIIGGAILALAHAIKYKKRTGSSAALLTLLGCFVYGLSIDILSYYTVENFWHGEFSVMFLYNRLPLYIACFYPAFMYHAYMMIRRYDFSPVVEAISVGFFASFMYLIFDNLGPMMSWWIWDTQDPTTWPYISSVPLTSYHWFFTFTIAFAFINRYISWELPAQKTSQVKLIGWHIGQPVLTILLGSLLFIPYNLFGQGMPPYDSLPWAQSLPLAALVHLTGFTLAGWLFLMHWRKPTVPRDSLLMVFPLVFLVGHAYLYVIKFNDFFVVSEDGLINGLAAGNLLAVIFAIVAITSIVIISNPVDKKG